jgi:hypothetical protein
VVFDALTEEQVEQLHDICATLARHSGGTYDSAIWESH